MYPAVLLCRDQQEFSGIIRCRRRGKMAEIIIDEKKCNGCGACVDACPGDVYELRENKAVVVNPDACHHCHTCEEVCEQDACHIVEEE
jgi:NAD-dependent dihydropyrimidine dehydrogenase PreA subunit